MSRRRGVTLLGKLAKNLGIYLVLIVLVVSLVHVFLSPSPNNGEIKTVTYSDLLNAADLGRIAKIVIDEDVIRGVYADGTEFRSYAVGIGELAPRLAAKGVNVEVLPPQKTPWWSSLMTSLFPTLLLIGAWIFILYNMQGGGSKVMNFSKSKAKLFLDNRPKVTFEDVAGCDESKEELEEVVDFLRDPGRFAKLGAKVPRGVLLLGSPGTGKTLLSRAVAGEADVPFFSISGSDFVEMFVGVGAARVRDLFEQARRYQPCIVFIDEIDAVGRQRGAGLGGGHDEREQTLNQLLVEMDGFEAGAGIILIAATNRPDILDPALLRPGRFDRQVVVDRPDVNGRLAILKVHIKDKRLANSVDLDVIARRTPGFVGADLANLVNEAALLAGRRNKEMLEMPEFEEAIDRVMAGPERKSRVISKKEREIIAYHEVGHAIVARLIPGSDPVHKISIIPRGHMALGYTLQVPEEDRFLVSKQELMNRICVLLGGRVTETIKFGDVTSGAQNDLERATQTARQMVTQLGMSDRLGPVTLGKKHHEVFLGRDIMEDRNYSEEIAYAIDQEVRRIIDECFERVREILIGNMTKVEEVTSILLEKEVLEGSEFNVLLNLPAKDDEDEPKMKAGAPRRVRKRVPGRLKADLEKKDDIETKTFDPPDPVTVDSP
jgi:cell division protease FtsH